MSIESTDYEAQLSKKLNPLLQKSVVAITGPVVFSYAEPKFIGISQPVTSQENARRYCFGVERAVMKFWGYSEKQDPALVIEVLNGYFSEMSRVIRAHHVHVTRIMGDVVNVASRIEGLARQSDSDIPITNEVRERIGDRFKLMELQPAQLKGKSTPIDTWALLGIDSGFKYNNEGRS